MGGAQPGLIKISALVVSTGNSLTCFDTSSKNHLIIIRGQASERKSQLVPLYQSLMVPLFLCCYPTV